MAKISNGTHKYSGDSDIRTWGGEGKFSLWTRVESEDHHESWTGAGHQTGDGDIIKHSRQSLHLQIEDGPDFRVLISPLPPKVEEEVKEVKKVIKKKNDNRSTISTQIFRNIFWPFECSDICTAGVRSTSVSAGCTTSRPREFLSSKLRPEWPVENVRLNIFTMYKNFDSQKYNKAFEKKGQSVSILWFKTRKASSRNVTLLIANYEIEILHFQTLHCPHVLW